MTLDGVSYSELLEMERIRGTKNLKATDVAMCSTVSGLIGEAITYPLHLAKTRLACDVSCSKSALLHASVLNSFRELQDMVKGCTMDFGIA